MAIIHFVIFIVIVIAQLVQTQDQYPKTLGYQAFNNHTYTIQSKSNENLYITINDANQLILNSFKKEDLFLFQIYENQNKSKTIKNEQRQYSEIMFITSQEGNQFMIDIIIKDKNSVNICNGEKQCLFYDITANQLNFGVFQKDKDNYLWIIRQYCKDDCKCFNIEDEDCSNDCESNKTKFDQDSNQCICQGLNRSIDDQCNCIQPMKEAENGQCICSLNYILIDQKCILCSDLPYRKLDQNNNCICTNSYYIDTPINQKCKPCQKYCIQCSFLNNCTQCQQHYLLDLNNQCIPVNERSLSLYLDSKQQIYKHLKNYTQSMNQPEYFGTIIALSQIGFIQYLVNSQPLFLIRLIKFPQPFNSFYFESLFAISNSYIKILDWDTFYDPYNQTTTELFTKEIDLTEFATIDHRHTFINSGLFPYFYVTCLLQLIIISMFNIFLIIFYIKEKSLIQSLNLQMTLLEYKQYLLELKKKLFQQFLNFYLIYIENQFGILIMTINISFALVDSKYTSILSVSIIIIFIILYLILQIFLVTKLKMHSALLNKFKNSSEYQNLLTMFQKRFWSFQTYSNLNQKINFFTLFISETKKIIFSIVIIAAYDDANTTLIVLGIIMCINLLYKIGFRINTNYLYFIMIILQDLSIIGFIFSKMNDLANSKDLFDDLDLSNEKINKWYDDGFITFGFEVSYCILSLIFCVIKTIKFIWDKCKKKQRISEQGQQQKQNEQVQQSERQEQQIQVEESKDQQQQQNLIQGNQYIQGNQQRVQNQNVLEYNYNLQQQQTPIDQYEIQYNEQQGNNPFDMRISYSEAQRIKQMLWDRFQFNIDI